MKKYILIWLGIEMLDRRISNQTLLIRELQQENAALKRRFNLSIDVRDSKYEPGRSWAVVSIRGKSDFVKFYDLGYHDLHHLKELLKQFDQSNVHIDVPHGSMLKRDLFNDMNY